MKTYYEILGVQPGAGIQDIKRAYYALAKKHHPDGEQKIDSGKSSLLFQRIKEAYETLSDPEKKKAYDKTLTQKKTSSPKQKIRPKNTKAEEFYDVGRDLYKSKKYIEAATAFHTALKKDSNNALYCSWLGLSLSHIPGRLHEAKEWCQRATELSPRTADFFVNFAIILKDAGIESMAQYFFKHALELDPGNKRARAWYKEDTQSASLKEVFKSFLGGTSE